MKIWKFPDQAIRLAILLALAVGALIAARVYFVPETFGEAGHYRLAAIDVVKNQKISYAGGAACVDCHDDVEELRQRSFHRFLSCEVCHGASAAHVDDPDSHLPFVPSGREDCLHCHAYLPSRPTGFPQIIEMQHNPMEPCVSCHDPHDPTPPSTPEFCGACHGQIARTKAISHHSSLDCETCHEVVEEHRLHPRSHLPTKPQGRDFCGRCHGAGSTANADAPKVDIDLHGGRYLCWQCHYPHFPEGR